jgi:preprotein translocase subunit Sss1
MEETMKTAHSPAELAKSGLVIAGIIGFFIIVIHQITLALG